jgi:deoxycytidylate deaminase
MNQQLQMAIDHARHNTIKPVGRNSISRFGAVLWNGPLMFFGWNSYKTHPLQKKFGKNDECIHIHAEIDCIVQATRWLAKQNRTVYKNVTSLSGFSLAVARVLTDGTPSIAMPCEGCQKALIAFDIKNMVWTK